MEFVRPGLGPRCSLPLPWTTQRKQRRSLIAGWPIARQHPNGQDGTVFVTTEDETGDTQITLSPRVLQQSGKQLGSHLLQVRGTVSIWDGTANFIASEVRGIHPAPRCSPPTTGAMGSHVLRRMSELQLDCWTATYTSRWAGKRSPPKTGKTTMGSGPLRNKWKLAGIPAHRIGTKNDLFSGPYSLRQQPCFPEMAEAKQPLQ